MQARYNLTPITVMTAPSNLTFLRKISEDQWLWILATTAVLTNYLLCVALFPLTDLDEGAYAGVTREMFVRGDWLSTYLNGEPWFEKPILMYWMQSIGVWLFGVNEWGFRLPSAVASALWFFIIYRFVAAEVNRHVGLIAALVTMTALGTTFIYKAAIPDPFLSLLITATVFDLYRHWKQPRPILVYRAFIWMGLGVLAKGPVAIVIPSLIAGAFYLIHNKFWLLFRAALNPIGWILILLIVVPWHWYQYYLFGDQFIDDYFFKHNVGRFTSSLDGHAGNLFFYLFSLFLLSFPFWKPLVFALKNMFSKFRSRELTPLQWLLIIWFLVVLGFFTLASTKLPHYLMYGMVPIFILIAMHLEEHGLGVWNFLITGVSFSAIILSLPFLLEWLAPQQKEFYRLALAEASAAADVSFFLTLALSAAMLGLVALYIKKSTLRSLLLGLIVSLQTSWILMPTVLNLQQLPLKQAALIAAKEDIHPVMWGMNMPSFSVYAQRITPREKPKPGMWVITYTHRLEELGNTEQAYEKGGISLAKVLPK